MLSAAEARLITLLGQQQDAAAAASEDPPTATCTTARISTSSRRSHAQQQQQRLGQQQRPQLHADAADLALFLGACGARSYTPGKLLRRYCVQLRQQLEDEGADMLTERPPPSEVAAAAAAARCGAPTAGRRLGNRRRLLIVEDAGPLAAVTQGLAAVGWRDDALLRELEAVAMRRRLVEVTTATQSALFLHSCRKLGYVPSAWLAAGLGPLLLRQLPKMGALDVCQVVCALAAWQGVPGGIDARKMSMLPMSAFLMGAQQQLLQQQQPQQQQQPASTPGAASSSAAAVAAPAAAAAGARESPASQSTPSDSKAAPSSGPTAASSSSSSPTATANLQDAPVLQLPPSDLVSLLHSLQKLSQYNEQLVALILSRLQQKEVQLSLGEVSTAAHAAAALRHEPAALLAVLRRRFGATGSPSASSSSIDSGDSSGGAGAGAVEVNVEAAGLAAFEGVDEPGSVASRILWTFGQLGQRPGHTVISATTAALNRWWDEVAGMSSSGGSSHQLSGQSGQMQSATAGGVREGDVSAAGYDMGPDWDFLAGSADSEAQEQRDADVSSSGAGRQQQQRAGRQQRQRRQQHLPLREVSTALYSLALLGELQHPGAVALASRLAALPPAALLAHPQFAQQARMLAACLLVAQAERLVSSPWAALDSAVKERLAGEWRRNVLARGAARPHRMQGELAAALRGMGLRVRAGEVTRDGVCCIDVLARAQSSGSGAGAAAAGASGGAGEWLAIEILGPHNATRNTQAPLGPARLKWRLLAARGYRVVVVDGWEWLRMGGPETVAKQMYLQNLRNQLLRKGSSGGGSGWQGSSSVSSVGGGEGRVAVGVGVSQRLNRPAQRR